MLLFRTQLPLRSSVFPILPFTLLLCNCTGINKTLFFHFKIFTNLFCFHYFLWVRIQFLKTQVNISLEYLLGRQQIPGNVYRWQSTWDVTGNQHHSLTDTLKTSILFN